MIQVIQLVINYNYGFLVVDYVLVSAQKTSARRKSLHFQHICLLVFEGIFRIFCVGKLHYDFVPHLLFISGKYLCEVPQNNNVVIARTTSSFYNY